MSAQILADFSTAFKNSGWTFIIIIWALSAILLGHEFFELREKIKEKSNANKLLTYSKIICTVIVVLLSTLSQISSQMGADDAEKKIAELEGRTISPAEKKQFIKLVETAPKGKVFVSSVASNIEAKKYAEQISSMLKEAGYQVEESFGSYMPIGAVPVGVQISIRDANAQPIYGGPLQRALSDIHIKAIGTLDFRAGDGVLVMIWNKP